MAAGFLKREWEYEERERERMHERAANIKATVFNNSILEVTYPRFCRMLLVPQTDPGTIWGWIHKGVKTGCDCGAGYHTMNTCHSLL